MPLRLAVWPSSKINSELVVVSIGCLKFSESISLGRLERSEAVERLERLKLASFLE
jgi:hypothetical protein